MLSPHIVLYLVDAKSKGRPRLRAAVLKHRRGRLMEKNHRGLMGAHLSVNRLFRVLSYIVTVFTLSGIALNVPSYLVGGSHVGFTSYSGRKQTCGPRLPHQVVTGLPVPDQ